MLGEVDPHVIERIVQIGASVDEVAEALSAIEDEDAYAEVHHLPSTAKVAEVRAILEEQVLDRDDDEQDEGPFVHA